jgi:enamine deaminase RidA (YjgF/YER057c/UK114 family)
VINALFVLFSGVDESEMTSNIDVRKIKSPDAEEIYISAVPADALPVVEQWQEIFAGIKNILISEKAYILQERVFGTKAAIENAEKLRLEQYGDINDGVNPSFLVCKEGFLGPVAGVQVHAVKSKHKPEVIKIGDAPCGRLVKVPGRTYLAMSGISAPDFATPEQQAKAMLERSEAVLKKFGAGFSAVPRTWMWLGDILSWYDRFNQVRNEFFTERGMITKKDNRLLPASTGIGLSPYPKGHCAMDLAAVIEPADSIKYVRTTKKQNCAFKYGSAFSRAAEAATPAAKTVFVSGTASIDTDGRSTNIDNPLSQINETIENVRALLMDLHCADKDVVQAIAYCKTAEVQKIFCEAQSSLSWPIVTMVCDICRPELLFEIEAAAVVPA